MEKFKFDNKTVVFIIKVCALAGAERQALGLARYLQDKYGCNVHFVATHSNIQTKEFEKFALQCGVKNIHYYGVPSLSIRKGWNYKNLKKTLRAYLYLFKVKSGIKKLQPDVIIPYMNFASKLSALIYKEVGAKYTFWHELGEDDNYYYDILEAKAIKKAPFFCANAEGGFSTFINTYNVDKNKCHVLTQYVSFDRVDFDKNKIKKELKIPENKFIFGMVAHYRAQKHPELLIEAFSEIAEKRNIHILFLGNKNNNEETQLKYKTLISLAQKLGVKEGISFLSGIEVEKVLSVIDVGVLVSEFEGAPTVLMEYMLYGKPIIATNHIGCKLLMGDSNFLIPKRDVNSLKERMIELYDSVDLRNEIGLKHLEDVKKYSIENYCERLTFLFQKYS